jgi:YD repeat-containing protein
MNFGRICFASALVGGILSVASNAFALQTPPSGQIYEYDLRGRLISTTYEDCSVIEYAYDLQGNRVTRSVIPGNDCGANSPPVAIDDAFTVPFGEEAVINPFLNDSDPDGHNLIVANVGQPDTGAVISLQSGGAVAAFKVNAPEGVTVFTYTVSDGHGGSATATVTLNGVIYHSASPVFSSSTSASVSENVPGTIYTAVASDADGDPITYSIAGGADAARFAINSSSGALSFTPSPDFENPTDSGGNNVYNVTLRASDGGNHADRSVAITVTDVNDLAPVWTSGTTASAAENQLGSGYTAQAIDADSGAVIYSIPGGVDGYLFNINSSSGVLTFKDPHDFENPNDVGANNVYNVILRASDGSLTSDRTVLVTVTNVNEAPVWTSSTTASAAENQTSAGYTAVATDPEGSARSYSIVGGADSARFSINASSGVLSFVSAPNYEAPNDSGANRVYDVTLRATAGGQTADRAVAVTLTNVNEPPVWTSGTTDSVAENTAGTFYTASATDVDGGALTYSIVGGNDASKFTINASSGALRFVSAPDYEAPADSGANNIYNVTLRVSDGSLTVNRALAVTVTNVAENAAPTAVADTFGTFAGATANILVRLNDSDPEGDPLTIISLSGAFTKGFASVVNSGTRVSYTAYSWASGIETFTYTISDGNGNTATATVTVNIEAGGPGGPGGPPGGGGIGG